MQALYLLASVAALGGVIAEKTGDWNLTISSGTTPLVPLKPASFPSIIQNTTLADGTVIVDSQATCWEPAKAPPIPANSTKYAAGTCGVCVSQSLTTNASLTLGLVQQYSVRIRDASNNDMGTVSNKTLAALDGFTGNQDTQINVTVAGKPFHLWTMRDPGYPWWAAVFMDWGGPGPADPFKSPPMVYSYAVEMDSPADGNGMVGSWSCGRPTLSRDEGRVYFSCGFTC